MSTGKVVLKTNISLKASQYQLVKKEMAKAGVDQSEAIRRLIERGADYDRLWNVTEILQLKLFFYLREIAKQRNDGDEFVRQIEDRFANVKESMHEALKESINHVGD